MQRLYDITAPENIRFEQREIFGLLLAISSDSTYNAVKRNTLMEEIADRNEKIFGVINGIESILKDENLITGFNEVYRNYERDYNFYKQNLSERKESDEGYTDRMKNELMVIIQELCFVFDKLRFHSKKIKDYKDFTYCEYIYRVLNQNISDNLAGEENINYIYTHIELARKEIKIQNENILSNHIIEIAKDYACKIFEYYNDTTISCRKGFYAPIQHTVDDMYEQIFAASKEIYGYILKERNAQAQNFKRYNDNYPFRKIISECLGQIYRKNVQYDLSKEKGNIKPYNEKEREDTIIKYENTIWNINGIIKDNNIKKTGYLLVIERNNDEIITIKIYENQIQVSVKFDKFNRFDKFDRYDEPIELIGTKPEDSDISISIINNSARIALYINDILQDEDWTLGKCILDDGKCIAMIGKWNITNDFSMDNRPDKNIAIETSNMQNWKPDGHNTGAGDCMPFWDGKTQTYHLFYLFDRRGHKSKWGLGAHQWAHISTQDFKKWTQHPMAISIDEQEEGSICTGSVIYYKGKYRAFYAVRMSDGSPAVISCAASDDCIHFEKCGSAYQFTLPEPYNRQSARDPMVFKDDNGTLHMLITTSILKNNENFGCLAHYYLPEDNKSCIWCIDEPIIMDNEKEPECPDYFFRDGKYYLTYNVDGKMRYIFDNKPFEKWENIDIDNSINANLDCRVPKAAKFGEDRIIAAGFQCPPGIDYAGTVFFAEISSNFDGTLEFTDLPELLWDN